MVWFDPEEVSRALDHLSYNQAAIDRVLQGMTYDQEVDQALGHLSYDPEEIGRALGHLSYNQAAIDRALQGMTHDPEDVNQAFQSLSYNQDEVKRIMGGISVSQKEIDRVLKGVALDEKEIDRLLQGIILSQDRIDQVFSTSSTLGDVNTFITEEYEYADFDQFDIDIFEDRLSDQDYELTVYDKYFYTKGAIVVLIKDICNDQTKTFVTSVILGTVFLPLIVQDPDVNDLEDLIRRIHWVMILAIYLLNDDS